MTIERLDGYLVDRDQNGLVSIGIESARLDQCVAEVSRRGALGVFGAPSFGFTQTDLDFLERLPSLQKIWFWDVALRDVDGIYSLRDLRQFGVHPRRPPISFDRLPALETMVWEHSPRDRGLSSLAHLSTLHVWHYKPRQGTFEGLALPLGIRELQLNWANPRTLAGLPELSQLRRLELHRCRNLESIAELPRIAPQLEHLVVAACGRVADGEAVVRRLPNLRHAFVRDTVLVTRDERRTEVSANDR